MVNVITSYAVHILNAITLVFIYFLPSLKRLEANSSKTLVTLADSLEYSLDTYYGYSRSLPPIACQEHLWSEGMQ